MYMSIPIHAAGDHGPKHRTGFVSLWSNLLAAVDYLKWKGPLFAAARVGQGLRLLLSLPQHFSVLRVLSHPQCSNLLRRYPMLAFKYLGDYVALGLPVSARRSIFVSHFKSLQRLFNAGFLESVQRSAPTLWRATVEQRAFHVTLELIGVLGCEGELRLVFYMDGSEVYRLIFVFASGREFGLPDQEVLIVTGIQGVHDFERVRIATKTCCDIQPAHLLMTAIGAIAEAARVATILGPHQTRQLFCGAQLFFSYGEFFETYGKEMPGQSMYRINVPYCRKPVLAIKPSHRRRNRRKRQFKAAVHRNVLEAVQPYLN
jgi:uncharacterized protein VirK/YbjX